MSRSESVDPGKLQEGQYGDWLKVAENFFFKSKTAPSPSQRETPTSSPSYHNDEASPGLNSGSGSKASNSAHQNKLTKSPLAQIPESSTPTPIHQHDLALSAPLPPPPIITSRNQKQPALTKIPPTHLIESVHLDPILLLTNQDIDLHLAGLPIPPEAHTQNMELETVMPQKLAPEANVSKQRKKWTRKTPASSK
ncbi:leucine-rich repeat, partial [Striga asiatica]